MTTDMYCDAYNCIECPIRFKCFTTTGHLYVSYEEYLEMQPFRWKLHDGSKGREIRRETWCISERCDQCPIRSHCTMIRDT